MKEAALPEYTNIPGWGIDVDPANFPAYPMRDNSAEDSDMGHLTHQKLSVEVLKSKERPEVSAVFGTSTPPKGISGMIRRKAFKYTESNWGHWLLLLLADRINVLEGIAQDLRNGRIPNIFSEMGLKAEMKHNPKGLLAKGLLIGGIGMATIVFIRNRDK